MTELELADKLAHPEGFVQISSKLLPQRVGRFCFVKMINGAEDFKAGAYALVDLIAKPKEGDRVLVSRGEGASIAVMRLKRSGEAWICAPLRKSRLHPIILTSIEETVLGVVERIFDID